MFGSAAFRKRILRELRKPLICSFRLSVCRIFTDVVALKRELVTAHRRTYAATSLADLLAISGQCKHATRLTAPPPSSAKTILSVLFSMK
jgi:hypothetical protein